MQGLGVRKFALHTMVASNELNESYFVETADIIFSLAADLHRELGVRFEFVNLGGGIGIPYRPEDKKPDIRTIARGIKAHYDRLIAANGLDPLMVCLECGRMITGPYGYLVTTAIHRKNIYRDYIGVDACMANLMRPALRRLSPYYRAGQRERSV